MDETLAPKQTGGIFHRVGLFFKPVPLLGYLLGFLACSLWEQLAGEGLTIVIGTAQDAGAFRSSHHFQSAGRDYQFS